MSTKAATYERAPCAYGHVGVYYKSQNKCVECVRLRAVKRFGGPEGLKRRKALYGSRKQRRAQYRINNRQISFFREVRNALTQRGKKFGLRIIDAPSALELQKLFLFQQGRCAYFGTNLDIFKVDWSVQLDHKTPLSRGGTNDIGNLQWVCKEANIIKADQTDQEFRQRLKELVAGFILLDYQ